MATQNTGEQGWTGLKKQVIAGEYAGQAVDINNKLVSVTGLPQSKKDNEESDPDYIEPQENLTACPIPVYNNYTLGVYEEIENSGFIVQIYAELRDEITNMPVFATVDINASANWVNRNLSTSVETPVTEQLNLTTGNTRLNLGTYDLSTNSCSGYNVTDVSPTTMDGRNIIGI